MLTLPKRLGMGTSLSKFVGDAPLAGGGVPFGYSLVTYNGVLVTYNGKRVITDGNTLYVEA